MPEIYVADINLTGVLINSCFLISNEHLKVKWNIIIERAGVAIGNLEGKNSLQSKLLNARRVSWMKGIERKIYLYCNKKEKYSCKWLKIYEHGQNF